MASNWPSFCSMRMPGGRAVSSLPLGPCTATVLPSILIVTPLGSAIGFFPIRDINSLFSSLPNLAQQLAAQTLFAGLATGHNAFRRGQNVDAHATEHARNLCAAHIDAATRPRHALDVRDGSFIVIAILQINPKDLLSLFLGGLVVRDVTLFLKDAGNLELQPGGRNIYLLVTRVYGVANARQHVCDRIGQIHRLLLLRHPLAAAIRYSCPAEEPAATCIVAYLALPGRLRNSRNLSAQGETAETQAANPELAEICTR